MNHPGHDLQFYIFLYLFPFLSIFWSMIWEKLFEIARSYGCSDGTVVTGINIVNDYFFR